MNYRELQALYDSLGPRGFTVIGLPCNQFGGQEPGSAKEIRSFVEGYGITFPIMAKIDVNGANTHPLYKFMKDEQGELLGKDIKWNFSKFLVSPEGEIVKRYPPQTSPSAIEKDILAYLPVMA